MTNKIGDEELVNKVHALVGRNAQVVYELQVLVKEEKVRDKMQQLEKESQKWGETLRWPWPCGWSERLITWATVRVQMMWHCATDETVRATLMWVSVEVVIGVCIEVALICLKDKVLRYKEFTLICWERDVFSFTLNTDHVLHVINRPDLSRLGFGVGWVDWKRFVEQLLLLVEPNSWVQSWRYEIIGRRRGDKYTLS